MNGLLLRESFIVDGDAKTGARVPRGRRCVSVKRTHALFELLITVLPRCRVIMLYE